MQVYFSREKMYAEINFGKCYGKKSIIGKEGRLHGKRKKTYDGNTAAGEKERNTVR